MRKGVKLAGLLAVRVAMVNRLELAGVGCRSRLMRTSLKRLVELTDEFCC